MINTITLEPPRRLGLLAPLAQHRIKAAVAANLDVLKKILQAEPG